jgi:hypothetical protein
LKNKILTRVAALLLLLLILSTLVACKGDDESISCPPEQNDTTAEDVEFNYDDINVADHVKSVTYKGLQINVEGDREDALWQGIYATAQIESYPEAKVSYYFEQTKKMYMELVDNDPDDYALLLADRGITEQMMLEQARRMVRDDLVYLYIVQTENIALTDAERTSLFDKYVDRYAVELGRPREYVAENMPEYIYESMLYDKTMEFLLASNELT